MAQGKRVEVSAAQRTEIWRRWKAGESLHEIGRAFGRKHTSIQLLLSHHGGIVPAVRRRSPQALTLAEREDISRGIASGLSIRAIATRLLGSGHNDPLRSTSIAILTSGSAHLARPAALFASDNYLECDVFCRGHLAKPSNNLGPVIGSEPAENLSLDSIPLFD